MARSAASVTPAAEDLAWLALAAGLRRVLALPDTPPVAALMQAAESTREDARWLARGQGLDAVVDEGLKSAGHAGVMEPRARARAAAAASVTTAEAAQISKHLVRAGCRHMFIKGALVEPCAWGSGAWRTALDIDVVVAPADESVASGVLEVLGYRRSLPRTHVATTLAGKERVFAPSPGSRVRVPVDLHVGLLNAPPFHDDLHAVMARATPWAIIGRAEAMLPGPHPDDLPWIMAGNLAGDRFLPRFKLAADLFVLMHRAPPDLGRSAERAQRAGCGWSMWALLELVRTRLGAPVDRGVLEALEPPPGLRRWVAGVTGVSAPPWRPRARVARLLVSEWPLSQSPSWPVRATWRWAGLRALDRLPARFNPGRRG